ncbi:MAG: M1 family metallopeptidase, partial [Bacteroidales bacterium]|nr:M1 family metallopeptidase [Bacteroidales bacterium]
MKKYIFTLFLIFSAVMTIGQYNVPPFPEEDYCHHIKSCENQLKTYYSPVSTNAFLDEYDVSFYFLNLEIENNTTYLEGNVTMKAKSVVTALDTVAIELISGMSVDTVYVNGQQRSFQHTNDLITIPLSSP